MDPIVKRITMPPEHIQRLRDVEAEFPAMEQELARRQSANLPTEELRATFEQTKAQVKGMLRVYGNDEE